MILIISVCSEKLHENEFVKPIEKFVGKNSFVKSFDNLTPKDLERADKVIISGTSLEDFDYMKSLDKFSWIKNFDKPLLGICAGMQIIGLTFGSKILEEKHVGAFREKFNCGYLDFKGEKEVYYLHNKAVSLPSNFFRLNLDLDYPTFFKHEKREIYGVLFHPEVYNGDLIREFVKD